MPLSYGELEIGTTSINRLRGYPNFPVIRLKGRPFWWEDFETTPASHVGMSHGGASPGYGIYPSGWGYFDSDPTAIFCISADRGVMGSRSLLCRSSTNALAGSLGKTDIHRMFYFPPNTNIIGVEFWFWFSNNFYNRQTNEFHLGVIETFDNVNHIENGFLYENAGTGIGIYDTAGNPFVTNKLFSGDSGTWPEGWHHFAYAANLITGAIPFVFLDSVDYTSSFTGAVLRTFADNSFSTTPNKPVRIEFGPINATTHTSPADDWRVYYDNIVVSIEG